MPSRRSVLASLLAGVSAVGSGCVSSRPPGTGTQVGRTPTTGTGGRTETTGTSSPVVETFDLGESAESRGGTPVTVSAARLRKIVHSVDVGPMVHPYPGGDADAQFLVVDVSTADGGDVASLPLAVALDGDEVTDDAYRLAVRPGASGALAFRVPISEPAAGAVEWRPSAGRRYRWTLPESVLAAVARSPAFEVRRFDVPDAVGRGERFEATLEVGNVGERDGRFLAAVYDRGSSSVPLVTRFAFDVPVGESVTSELSGRTVEGDRSDVTAILDWGVDRREASFELS